MREKQNRKNSNSAALKRRVGISFQSVRCPTRRKAIKLGKQRGNTELESLATRLLLCGDEVGPINNSSRQVVGCRRCAPRRSIAHLLLLALLSTTWLFTQPLGSVSVVITTVKECLKCFHSNNTSKKNLFQFNKSNTLLQPNPLEINLVWMTICYNS